jgi:hypothetical protein
VSGKLELDGCREGREVPFEPILCVELLIITKIEDHRSVHQHRVVNEMGACAKNTALVDKLKPDLLVVSASSVTSAAAVARYQAELNRVAANTSIKVVLAGSGAWAPASKARRVVTFQDLRSLLVELPRSKARKRWLTES